MRKEQKDKFMWIGASDVERATEWKKNGKIMTARTEKEDCGLKVCQVRKDRKIHRGEQFYVASSPAWVAHKQCVETLCGRHEAMLAGKKFKEQEMNRVIPLSTVRPEFVQEEKKEEVEVPPAASYVEEEYRPAQDYPLYQEKQKEETNLEHFDLLQRLKYLEGFKAATELFLKSQK